MGRYSQAQACSCLASGPDWPGHGRAADSVSRAWQFADDEQRRCLAWMCMWTWMRPCSAPSTGSGLFQRDGWGVVQVQVHAHVHGDGDGDGDVDDGRLRAGFTLHARLRLPGDDDDDDDTTVAPAWRRLGAGASCSRPQGEAAMVEAGGDVGGSGGGVRE